MRILLTAEPKKITVTDAAGNTIADAKNSWDKLGKTCLLSFENNPDGVKVLLEW
jgi:hypothetical protein